MGTKEASAWLREQVPRQVEEFSTLENFHLSTYLLYFSSGWFLPLACRPSCRAGQKGEVVGAEPRDGQGDFWPKCRGVGQVP